MAINYNLYSCYIELIDLGYNVSQISNLLNIYELKVKSSLGQLREDLIDSFTSESFETIRKIDKVLGKKEIDSRYLDAITLLDRGNSNEVVQHYIGWGIDKYLHILKSSYYFINEYGSNKNKRLLSTILSAIGETNKVLKSRENLGRKNTIISSIDRQALFGKNSKKLTASSSSVRSIADLGQLDYIRFINVSDMHLGSEKENLIYLDDVYEYATRNGIKYIFNSGDVIQGNVEQYRGCKKEYKCAEAQIEHLLKDHCYDKNIKNYILLGNHDASLIYGERIDLYDYLHERDDFVPLGYKTAYIKIGNEYISLRHDVSKLYNSVKDDNGFINYYGHSHQFETSHCNDEAIVKVPTLSDVSPGTLHKTNKGFLDSEVHFQKGKASEVTVDYIPVEGEIKRILR